jgi:hypothetical protein
MSTLSRFPGGPGKDNTARVLNNEVQSPSFAASIAITASKAKTLVNVALLTGALALSINVGNNAPDDIPPFVGDEVEFLFASDATGRVVTFGAGFASAGTLSVVASKFGSAKFKYNGSVWVETGRSLTA